MNKPIPSTTHGTVMIYSCTLHVQKVDNIFILDRLKFFALDAIKKVGLTFRKFSHEKYGSDNAITLVAYLNESHFIITTYPESKILELELASCRIVSLTDLIHWIKSNECLTMLSSFVIDKDEYGKWMRGF